MATEVVGIAQMGFAAVAFWLVWKAYQELIPQLLDIIKQNSEMIARFGGLLEVHTRSIDGLREAVGILDARLGDVEDMKRHKATTNRDQIVNRREE